MTGIGKETARVREHAHESAQVTAGSEIGEMLLHAGLVVEEPPCRPILDLAFQGGILEAARKGDEFKIHLGIQIEKDHRRETAFVVQAVHQTGKILHALLFG